MPDSDADRIDAPPAPDTTAAQARRPSRARLGIALLLILALAGYAYWRFIYYPTTPQYAVDRFFDAAQAKDYDTLYDLVQVPLALKLMVPNARALQAIVERVPGFLPSVEGHRLLSGRNEGDSAVLETEVTLRGGAGAAAPQSASVATFRVRMVRVDDKWKIDGRWIMEEMARRGAGDLLKSLVF